MERFSQPLPPSGAPRGPGPAASPRAWAARLRAAIGLALAVPLAIGGCLKPAAQPGGHFALQAPTSRLAVTVAPTGRALQYLKSVDWDVAVAELSRGGDAPVALTASAEATPSPDGRARSATLSFPAVAPGPGYRLRVSLRRRDAAGEREVGGSERADLTLLPGENSLALPAALDPRQPVTVGTVRGLEPYVTSVPGAGLSAALSDAQDVWWASAARCYFLDAGRLGLAYRTADGQTAVRTLAGADKALGTGLVDGPGAQARFGSTRHLVVAPSGTIYVADASANAIRRVIVDARGDAVVSTVAGGGAPGDADGPGATATFNNPSDLALDAAGDLYVADTDNHRVRKVSFGPGGAATVSTVAGSGTAGFLDGPAADARFRNPGAIAVLPDGRVAVADSRNFRLRAIGPDAGGAMVVETLAGSGVSAGLQDGPADDDGVGAAARLGRMAALRIGPDGALYANDTRLRRIAPEPGGGFRVETLGLQAGLTSDFARDDLELEANGLGFDDAGAVLLALRGTLRRLEDPRAAAPRLASWVGDPLRVGRPQDGLAATAALTVREGGMCVTRDGDVVLTGKTAIYLLPGGRPDATPELIAGDPAANGHVDGVGAAARFHRISFSSADPAGGILLGDIADHTIRRLDRQADGRYAVSTIAGRPNVAGFRNGPADQALFNNPDSAVALAGGRIAVADRNNRVLRLLTPDGNGSYVVSTLAGREPTLRADGSVASVNGGYLDGPALSARLYPLGGWVAPDGSLLFNDNHTAVRKLTFVDGQPAMVSTIAGNAGGTVSTGGTGYVDGPIATAKFVVPNSVAPARDGSLYVGDNDRIRRIYADRLGRTMVETFAGAFEGNRDGGLRDARFGDMNTVIVMIAFNSRGDLFALETDFGGAFARLRRISGVDPPPATP